MKAALIATFVLFGLAACGQSDDNANPTPAPTEATTTALAGADDFVAALGDIDPALAEDPDSAVSDARNVCLDLEQGKDDATVITNTGSRFSVDETTAEKIVDAAKEHLC